MKFLKQILFPCMDKMKEANERKDDAIRELKAACLIGGNCKLSAIPVRVRNDKSN